MQLSHRHFENLLYMSVRYAVGRHTGNAVGHAMDICKESAYLMTPEMRHSIGKEIRRSIYDVLHYIPTIHFNGLYGDVDIWNPFIEAINKFCETNTATWGDIYFFDEDGVVKCEIKPLSEDPATATSNYDTFTQIYADLNDWALAAAWLLGETKFKTEKGKVVEYVEGWLLQYNTCRAVKVGFTQISKGDTNKFINL